MIYDSCPRAHADDIWWPRTEFVNIATETCPIGTVGTAERNCTEEGWMEPQMFNCTSLQFVELKRQVGDGVG